MTNFNEKYTCESCGTISMRSTSGWKLECTCGGTMTSQQSGKEIKDQYNYICAACGNHWSESTDITKLCTKCNSLDIVIQYEDVNTELYADIQKNIANDKRYTWKCSCGNTKDLYSSKIYNVTCICECDDLMRYLPDVNVLKKLKEYRKKKRWTQNDIAKRYRISRSYYTLIESGKKPIPIQMMKLISEL